MKTHLLLFKLIIIIVFTGCSSNSNEDDNTGFMRAKIDGVAWEANEIIISNLNVFDLQNFQQYSLQGGNENFKIAIAINEQIASNCSTVTTHSGITVQMSYSYILESGNFVTEYFNNNSDVDTQSDLIINVTACDDGIISGTFSGTLYRVNSSNDTISITDGEFNNIEFIINNN